MRIAGYILLLVGLLIILVETTVGRSERRAIWIGRSHQVLQEDKIPVDGQAAKAMADMNRSWHDAVAIMAIPAIMMAIGGVFLDQGKRNEKRVA